MDKPLNYVPYVKQDAMKLLVDQFGWQAYPQKHFESRFTKFYEGYWLFKKFGFDQRKAYFSSLILTQQMARAEAVDRLVKPPYDEATIKQEFVYIATKLGIEPAELEEYMAAPNKSYRDYKNQLGMFEWGSKIMAALGLERRAIR